MAPQRKGCTTRRRKNSKNQATPKLVEPTLNPQTDEQLIGQSSRRSKAPTQDSAMTLLQETLQTLIQTMVSSVVTKINQDRGSMSEEARYFGDFKTYDPRSFDGISLDPAIALSWLSSIETIFHYMKCPEEQKLQCAVFMLKDDALLWWEFVERSIDVTDGPVTWIQFKEAFLKKYYPSTTRSRKKNEFLNLKQGSRSIDEYEREFIRLSRFAPELVDTETKKIERFIMGLKNWGLVMSFSPLKYDAARHVAVCLELDICASSESQEPTENEFSSRQKRKLNHGSPKLQ